MLGKTTARLVPVLLVIALLNVGCGREQPAPPRTNGASTMATDAAKSEINEAISQLPVEDQAAAREQRFCPVSGEPLGSMGAPIKMEVQGRKVFICCAGCEDALRSEPEKYLAKLDTQE